MYPWAADDAASSYSWTGADHGSGQALRPAVSNAVRGFPPAPGDQLPVYPPGPFAAWNRSPAGRGTAQRERGEGRNGSAEQLAIATITPDEFDTDYSLPAIKDPKPGRAGEPGTSGRGTGRQAGAGQRRGADAAPGQRRGGSSHGGRSRGDHPAGQPRSRTRGRRKHQSVWLAIGGAVAIIAAGTLFLVFTSSGSTPNQPKAGSAPTPTPAQSSPQPPSGKWEYIGNRNTDAAPLTMRELFPDTFKNAGGTYQKVKQAKGKNCTSAIIGGTLQTAVKQAGCTQAVRATYVARTGGVMATIGVFNLDTAAAASKAATKAGHSDFVAQLQSKRGPAQNIGQGTGIEEALFKGHFLILVWAEATNLHSPKNKADRTRLESFMNLLVAKTANVSLSFRMVYGKPSPPTSPS